MSEVKEAVKAAAKLGAKISLPAMPKSNLPKTKLGGLADELHALRALRLALNKITEAVKAEEQRVTDHIIDTLDTSVEGGAVGKHYKAIVVRESKPVAEDWEKLYEHIRKTKSFDLLNKALNAGAVKARVEDGKAIPGVGFFQAKKLSITKV